MSEKTKDVLTRAFKTFWQTALASLIFAMPEITNNLDAGWEVLEPLLISVGVGALSAGLCAAYNGVLKPVADKITHKTSANK